MATFYQLPLFISAFTCLTTAASSDNWSNVPISSYSTLHEGETAGFYYTAFINITFVDPMTGRFRTERSEIGKFGEDHVGYASGVLVHIKSGEDNSGCTIPFRSTKYPGDLPREPWIALIKRGDCNFQVKVDNAYKSNASGVIIYNNEDNNVLEKMMLKSSGRRVAVFTYKWKGEELARLLDNGTRILTNISVGNNCRVSYNINRTSVLFVSISFIVLMIISLAWLVFYYVQRFRYIHAKDRLSRRLCSAAKKALSKIPTKHIKSDDKEMQGDGECCAICIEPYKTSDVVRILPCRHEFHRSCIDPWLLEHRTCPMCKMDILKHYGFVFTGSQESILHMDIEEAVSDSESIHHRSLSPVPQIRSSDGQASSSGVSQETTRHQSRSTTPDEFTPALSIPGPSSDTSIAIRIPSEVQGGQMVISTSEFLSAKTNSQLRRSVSLDNCELTSNSKQ